MKRPLCLMIGIMLLSTGGALAGNDPLVSPKVLPLKISEAMTRANELKACRQRPKDEWGADCKDDTKRIKSDERQERPANSNKENQP